MDPEDKTSDTSTDDGDVGSLTFGGLRKLIREVMSEPDKETETRKAGRRAVETRLDRDSATEEAVEKAIKRLKDEDDRKAKEDALHGRLAAIEQKTADKPPVERSKLHKFMGWGD